MGVGAISVSQTAGKRVSSARHGLDPFFSPKTVAVIGATDKPGSVGRTVLVNLLHGTFKGKVFAVNPKRRQICGVQAFSAIQTIPEPIDLAIVVTPS